MPLFFIIISLSVTLIAYYKNLNGEDIGYLLIILFAAELLWGLYLYMEYVIAGFSVDLTSNLTSSIS